MLRSQLIRQIGKYAGGEIDINELLTAVDAYSSASNGAKPHVGGSLPTSAEIATAAQLYVSCDDNTATEDDYVYAAGHFVAGATWMLVQAGGNDR